METVTKMVVILFSLLAVVYCTDSQQLASGGGNEENHVETVNPLTVFSGDQTGNDGETVTAVAAEVAAVTVTPVTADRSARQFYQSFAYQPQRRAFKGPGKLKARPLRAKGRRPGGPPRPRRRPSAANGPAPGRFRRFPPPVRQQHVNYIDNGADYDDGYESMSTAAAASYDYGEREFADDAAAYGGGGVMPFATQPVMAPQIAQQPMTVLSAGRARKRPVGFVAAMADDVIHVPMRVARPAAATTVIAVPSPPPAAPADPMDKLRQLVHEAMDEHFANRHQELYADGFAADKHVYSAKYKRQPTAAAVASADKSNGKLQRTDATKSSSSVVAATTTPSDADADGSDDRLTLAEISAYMGAKPAETVLSAGGHRYVLSDALQLQLQQQQPHQQQQQQQQRSYAGRQQQLQQYDDAAAGAEHRPVQHQYLRYVSPFETLYELPARWTYK